LRANGISTLRRLAWRLAVRRIDLRKVGGNDGEVNAGTQQLKLVIPAKAGTQRACKG
jgi:hypothetical protein